MMKSTTSPSLIPDYFVGQTILITGGTGFMGKVLVEKLLRCCPGVAKIYLLARPKKHKSVEERWKEITELPLFDILKSTNPNMLNKVEMIQGDIEEEDIGVSSEDLETLIENVTLVYHAAAMIQFTDNLHSVLVKNTRATFALLEMAKSMKKLRLFVHVSTAYSNMNIPCDQAVERVIPPCQDWKILLQLLKHDPISLSSLKEKLMGGHPNPYTWSKSLAEQIVADYSKYFPTTIIRPSVVLPTCRDPIRGWGDILSGISAISLPIGLGLMRVVYSKPECFQDWVPCDIAINAIIVATYAKSVKLNEGDTDVYNCCVVKELPITTHHLKTYGEKIVDAIPSKNIVWAYHCICTTNDFLYHLLFFFLQVIPATILDGLRLLMGQKPILLHMTKKVTKLFKLFQKFSSAQIAFPNDNFKQLEDYVREEDKENFSMSVEGLTVYDVMDYAYLSALKYILKEDINEKALERNKRRLFWLIIITHTMILLYMLTNTLFKISA